MENKITKITLKEPLYMPYEYKLNRHIDGGYDVWIRKNGSKEEKDWMICGIGLCWEHVIECIDEYDEKRAN